MAPKVPQLTDAIPVMKRPSQAPGIKATPKRYVYLIEIEDRSVAPGDDERVVYTSEDWASPIDPCFKDRA